MPFNSNELSNLSSNLDILSSEHLTSISNKKLGIMAGLLTLIIQSTGLAQSATIKVDGSSTVYPISEAMAEEFQTAQKGKVKVTVGVSGTGGGFKKFCRGDIDIQDASRPIQKAEMEICKAADIKFIELPIAYDAMVIVVNPQNNWVSEITLDELKKMWEPEAQGKITMWNQVNLKWPAQKLKLYGAGSDSGTFDYFTEAVNGKSKASRGDYTASEDDNTLILGVANDKYALGYVPFSYYEENKKKLKALGVISKNKDGKLQAAVLPSRETVEKGTYVPFSRPLFIYVSEKSMKRPEVMDFVNFYMSKSESLIPSAKGIPLPGKVYTMAKDLAKKGRLGTVFNGQSDVGVKVEDLLKRETQL